MSGRFALPGVPALSEAARYRWAVASRALAAIVGGYALASACAAALAVVLPLPRVDATLAATLSAFMVYACAVLWVFAAHSAGRAWAGLLIPGVALAGIAWFFR